MAKWPDGTPGFGGLGFWKLGDLPKWLFINFSSNVLSVAFGNIDSSSRIDRIPIGCLVSESTKSYISARYDKIETVRRMTEDWKADLFPSSHLSDGSESVRTWLREKCVAYKVPIVGIVLLELSWNRLIILVTHTLKRAKGDFHFRKSCPKCGKLLGGWIDWILWSPSKSSFQHMPRY